MSTHYAAIVIGSGQAGGPLATALANAGQKVALIESTHVGGTCVNEGCTPTKTMVASARIAHITSRARDYGVEFDPSNLATQMGVVRRRKRDIVDSFREGSEKRLKDLKNLDLIFGKAKLVGDRKLEVTLSEISETRQLEADKIFINIGCSPSKLTIPGIERVKNLLDSTSIMELSEVPQHLIVVGGGYVGLEFAQMFRRFGSKVSILQRGSRLLPREDEDISAAIQENLAQDGIDIYTSTTPQSVENGSGPVFEIVVKLKNGKTQSLHGTHLLVAGGRTPNTGSLNVKEATSVETDSKGFIKTNDKLETNVSGVYALGDVKGGPAFTHVSYDDFRIVQHNLIDRPDSQPRTINDRMVPYTVFTDPQLGRIGLTEAEARKLHPSSNIKVAKMPMAYVARAIEVDETRGVMKAVVDADTKKILGFACLGIEGGEIASMVQIAMMGGLGYDQLQSAVFAHPTLAESLNNLWGSLE